MLLLGDCNYKLKDIQDNSIDLLVTDPPYGIEFMGKDWDRALVHTETWKECYRVLKQGKLAFVMCSPRQDVLARMIINLQDAGFRTNYSSIYWTYASGFPKAANVSKLIDKKNGKESDQDFRNYMRSHFKDGKTGAGLNRYLQEKGIYGTGSNMYSDFFCSTRSKVPPVRTYEIIKEYLVLDNRYDDLVQREEAEREVVGKDYSARIGTGKTFAFFENENVKQGIDITKPATEEAKKMEGAYVGFQPKPAVEVILVVSKGKTLTWLDDCRIPYQSEDDLSTAKEKMSPIGQKYAVGTHEGFQRQSHEDYKVLPINEKGRFPANLLVSDDVLNNGKITKSSNDLDRFKSFGYRKWSERHGYDVIKKPTHPVKVGGSDEGSYSRYFSLDSWAEKTLPFLIVAKASKSERNKGVETMQPVKVNDGRQTPIDNPFQRGETLRTNSHPTVKPLKLMSYLITMGSREGDLVLDPFCGSGTVCIAADQLHRKWIGIERNPEYAEIIKKRLMVPLSQLKLSVWSDKKKEG